MQPGSYRVVATFIIVIIWGAITVNFGRGWTGEHHDIVESVNAGLSWPLLWASLFLVAVLLIFRWRDVGLTAPQPGTLKLTWLPLLFIAVFLAIGVAFGLPPVSVLGIMLVNSLMVGWSEEMAFRGVLFSGLRSRFAIWPSIVVTTLLFGAVHVLNGFGTGNWPSAFVQAATAAMSGLLFVAILIRTGSIVPAMVVHALWDYSLFVSLTAVLAHGGPVAPDPGQAAENAAGASNLLLPFALAAPNFLYGLWLLRKVR